LTLSRKKVQNPARLASFRVEVKLPELEERHRQGLERAVKACLIHNTLKTTPEVEVEVSVAEKLCQWDGVTALALCNRERLGRHVTTFC
jgi:hypothetical protein